MKKVFLFIALALAFAVQSEAQRVNIPPTVMTSSTYGASSDTVTSTAAKYLVSGILPATQYLRVAAVFTEISGTTAGTASLEGSIDGTIWFTLTRDNSDSAVASFSLTDVASQTVSWSLSDPTIRYVRLKTVGISTPNFRVQAKVYGVARQ
jgi:hypothetical protein